MSERTRTTQSSPLTTFTYFREEHQGVCGNPDRITGTFPGNTQTCVNSVTKTITDWVTPNFYARSKKGEIINNPYSRVIEQELKIPGTLSGCTGTTTATWCPSSGSYENLNVRNVWSGQVIPDYYCGDGYLGPPDLDLGRVIDLAVTGSWAKADLSETQGLVTLAEGEKTVASVASILKRLFRIGRMLYRLDVRGLYRQLSAKELSNRYMECRYAIRPLLYDMKTSLAAFQAKKSPQRQTFRSFASDTGSASQADQLTYQASGWFNCYSNKSVTRTVTARAGVLAAITSISEASIWGLDKPMEAIWELVPFSFVVDWFCNVGRVIASWSPSPGINPLASWVVTDDVTVTTIAVNRCVGTFTGVWNTAKVTGASRTKITSVRRRVVNPNRAIVPRMNIRLDGFKLLDLAIMAKRFF